MPERTEMDRRDFLKKAATAAVGLAAGAVIPFRSARAKGPYPNDELDRRFGRKAGAWVPSCCNMCGGQCGIMAHVVEGRVVKIEPNQWNPNNFSNVSDDFFGHLDPKNGLNGEARICPKGNSGIMALYDPDRLKKPLRRTNPEKGIGVDPKWKEISWEEAIGEIADRLKALRNKGQAHKTVWISEDHSFTHIQADFMNLYGSPNYYMHSNLCDTARKASFKMVVGHDRPLCDFMHTKYILLFGWNPTSALKWIHLGRIIPKAIEQGAKMVVVDPYLSDTAAKGHEWVSIRPGTDGAMALAMAHVIVKERLYDEKFIQEWTYGFEELKDYVSKKTPAWAEKVTSVPAKTIERIAREVATTKPALIDVWSGPGQHTNGVQGGRAIAALNTLIGAWDAPGGMLIPNNKGNKHVEVHPDETATKTLAEPYLDGHDKLPFGHKSGNYTEFFRRIAKGEKPYPCEFLMVIFQNPMMAVPGTKAVEEAFQKIPFTVVVDTMPSETVQMADIALPGSVYLERYDLNTHWVTWPVLALRQPVVKPLFGQPTEYEFVALLGRKLNIKDTEGKPFFWMGRESGKRVENVTKWYEEFLSGEIKEGEPKMTLGELKKLSGAVWVSPKGTEYRKYAKPLKPEDLAKAVTEDGSPYRPDVPAGTGLYDKPKKDKGKRIGTMWKSPEGKVIVVKGFDTPSGLCEFYQPKLADKKDFRGRPVDPYPAYAPRDEQPSAEFPLYLINWKEAAHTHTRTWNNQWLRDLRSEAPLMIHPETAKKHGVGEGDEVLVESARGSIRMKAHLTRRIHAEVVGAQHGAGHWALGRFASASGKGQHPGFLNEMRFDPLSGQACHKEICVKIRKA
ncbi:MAG: molybdopterin-dependent oxidoreductase [Elusimicrobia bacterium]|nr:molybdopterin-dependent oxidoreductase [Elusimicrobiota bacterium]